MNEDKCISGAASDQRRGDNGFPESGRGGKNTVVMRNERVEGFHLRRSQVSFEGQSLRQRPAKISMIFQNNFGTMALDEIDRFLKAAPGQGYVAPMEFGARDDPRLVECRQPHGLRAIELGVLERRQANELGSQRRRKPSPINIHLIRDDDLDALRDHSVYSAYFASTGRRHSPRLVGVLVFHRHPDAENPTRQLRCVNDPANRLGRVSGQG